MTDTLETTKATIPVKFTQAAVSELKRLLNTDAATAETVLRIGVKGGGCSGMTYVLAFDKPEANDNHFEYEGIPMIMNKAHGMYLIGMQVDYEDGLNSRGFVFVNPNAKSTCGCGTSFSI